MDFKIIKFQVPSEFKGARGSLGVRFLSQCSAQCRFSLNVGESPRSESWAGASRPALAMESKENEKIESSYQ